MIATTSPAALPLCRAVQLRASAKSRYPRGMAAGQDRYAVITDFTLVNTSTSACALSGWAGLTRLGDSAISTCNVVNGTTTCPGYIDKTSRHNDQVTNRSGTTPLVTLRPAAATQFSASFDRCYIDFEGVYEVQLRMPGDSAPITVVRPDLDPCDRHITVTPFGTTA